MCYGLSRDRPAGASYSARIRVRSYLSLVSTVHVALEPLMNRSSFYPSSLRLLGYTQQYVSHAQHICVTRLHFCSFLNCAYYYL